MCCENCKKLEKELNELRDAMRDKPFGYCSVCRWNPCRCR